MTNFFAFKQFKIYHDRCAMKVGTDGVLLGAWADVSKSDRILDIGCGSGLISIMVAQRSQAYVYGVEIEREAALQAKENAVRSPWASRISIVCDDISNFQDSKGFDTILVNPPFFEEDLLPPDAARASARHTVGLSFATLLQQVSRLLCNTGRLYVIIPTVARERFMVEAVVRGFVLNRLTRVVTRPFKAPKRLLCAFSKVESVFTEDTLLLMDEKGERSEQYQQLTKDFYIY